MSKKNLVALDTNVIIRFLVRDDELLYHKSLQFFNDIENDRLQAVILESVFAEAIFVLEKVYQVERKLIAELITQILELKGIRQTNIPWYQKTLENYQSRKMSIVDCLLCAYSIVENIEIATFDKVPTKTVKQLTR